MVFAIVLLFGFIGIAQSFHGWTVTRASDKINIDSLSPRSIFQEIWNICNEDNCSGRIVACYRCLHDLNVVLEASGNYQGGWEGRKRMIEALMESVGTEGGEYINNHWYTFKTIHLNHENGDHVEVKIFVEKNQWTVNYSVDKVKLEKVWPGDIYRKLWDLCQEKKCSGSIDAAKLNNGKHVFIYASGSYKGGWETRGDLVQSLLSEVQNQGIWYSKNIFYPGWRVFSEVTMTSDLGHVRVRVFLMTEHDIYSQKMEKERFKQNKEDRERWEQQEKERRRQHREEQWREDIKDKLSESYRILEVSPDASNAEIKKKWIAKMLQFHPDKHAGKSEEEVREFTVIAQKLNQAYDEICDYRSRFQA